MRGQSVTWSQLNKFTPRFSAYPQRLKMEPPAPLDPLLAKHRADIEALRTAIGSALPANWDEISLLRYCLSFPDSAERLTALRSGLAWREKNAAMLADAAAGRPAPHEDVVRRHMVQGLHGASIHGEPLYIVRAGLSSATGLLVAVPSPDILQWLMYYKEAAFLRCDAETRARRTLVKMVSVIDMAHSRMSDTDRRFFAVLAESGKISEFVYPQMQAKNVMLHPPSFMYAAFALFRPLMTKKMLDKQAICPGGAGVAMSARGCPYASKRFDIATLPSFAGGGCHCTAAGGCICGVPNEETGPHGAATLRPAGAPQHLTVPARSHHDLLLPSRAPGSLLSWAFTIEEKGLEVSAWVTAHGGGAGSDAPAPVELVAKRKHNASEGRVSGSVAVPIAGTVTLRLDNSHSVLTGKRVTVEMRVQDPSGTAAGGKGAAGDVPAALVTGGSANTEDSALESLSGAVAAASIA